METTTAAAPAAVAANGSSSAATCVIPAASGSANGSSAAASASPAAAAPSVPSPGAADASSSSASASIVRSFVLNLPPGFHFLPTDAELVVHFLRPKLAGLRLPLPIVVNERVLNYHPKTLIDKYRKYGENRWFFFTTRERKHASGSRPNRTTVGNGHWNATGSKRPIYSGGALVGCVGTLVFYEASRKKNGEEALPLPLPLPAPEEVNAGPELSEEEDTRLAPKGVKTEWTMYEYESLMSEAEFEAKRNADGKIDQLVLCTIQKKKHCEEGKDESKMVKGQCKKDKKNKKKGQEGIPTGGKGEQGSRVVGGKKRTKKKEKGQEGLHAGGKGEQGGRVVGGKKRKRKELIEEQEEYVKRTLMAEELQQPVRAALGEDNGKTDADTAMPLYPTNTSSAPVPFQEMMMAPAGGDSLNVYPNSMMHQKFDLPLKSLQAPEPEEFLPYQQANWYTQHMQVNTMAPPLVYSSRGFGPGISNYGYSNNNYLHRINLNFDGLSSLLFPPQPSHGIGGSTGRMFMPSAGYNGPILPPKL